MATRHEYLEQPLAGRIARLERVPEEVGAIIGSQRNDALTDASQDDG